MADEQRRPVPRAGLVPLEVGAVPEVLERLDGDSPGVALVVQLLSPAVYREVLEQTRRMLKASLTRAFVPRRVKRLDLDVR